MQIAIPSLSSESAVALWLAGSGGTFLYASCIHVLPHVLSSREHGVSWVDILAVVLGCVTPIVIQILSPHTHSHTSHTSHEQITNNLSLQLA